MWLSANASEIPNVDDVARILANGAAVRFWKPEAPSQQTHPRHKSIMRQVLALLHRVMTPGAAAQALRQSQPALVVFANHPSALQNADSVDASLQDLCASGALVPVEALGFSVAAAQLYQCALVVTPMGVATRTNGKQRLIFDSRYVNCFCLYQSFSATSWGAGT